MTAVKLLHPQQLSQPMRLVSCGLEVLLLIILRSLPCERKLWVWQCSKCMVLALEQSKKIRQRGRYSTVSGRVDNRRVQWHGQCVTATPRAFLGPYLRPHTVCNVV